MEINGPRGLVLITSELSVGHAIMVDKSYWGASCSRFALRDLHPRPSGNERRMDEVYFTTASLNTYRIGPDLRSDRFSISDVYGSLEVGRLNASLLTDEEMRNGVLHVGRSFSYGQGDLAEDLQKIIAVDTQTNLTYAELLDISGGSHDPIRRLFWDAIPGPRS